ncbi:MAG: alpha-amylase family glycosyl hydrolase, partial [Alistipes sp.]|nr:alpha-amylase family glycosyl hydrolase [Alistipes sp.]
MRLTSIFKVVAVAALSFVAVSCATNEAKFALGDNAPVVPMGIAKGETTHYLTDYYPQWVGAENITTADERLTLENLSGDWSEFAVKTDAETLVSTIEVYHDGKPLSIVVLGGKRDTEGSYMSTIGAEDDRVLVVASQPVTGAVAVWQNNVIEDVLVDDSAITVTIPAEAKNFDRSVVRIFAASETGRFNDVLVPLQRGVVVTNADDIRRTDHQSQILYSLMIDRFNNGNTANDWKINSPEVLDKVDYQGGDLAGITAKINDGFFQDLGITTIWISPITQNPYDAWGQNVNPDTKFSGYHGYWPIYSTVVDKRFGTEDELREMLSTAHGSNMNVILDYVANHLHINSPVLQEHPDWTTNLILPDGRENIALWDEQRLTTWFDKHIPTLDLEREEVCEPMTDSALHWVKNFEFDGYRHDACKHIPLNYWRMLTHKMKSAMPERNMWQIGETYGSVELIGSYVKSGMIDSQFDFNLYHNSRDVIVDDGRSMRLIAATVEESEAAYGSHHTMGNITGNHDKPRFISLAGGDMPLWGIDDKAEGWHREVVVGDMDKGHAGLQLLKAIITTVPGVPCIYQGDEYGVP